nr:FAD-binding and (Fe-S)-binding domain-containing protein [Leucobacter sp. wl10]
MQATSELPGGITAAITDAARILTRPIDRHAYGSDASHYDLTPKAVVVVENADEAGALMRAASSAGESVTFRSGGTSLSGQGVTDGILADTRRSFRKITVLDGGSRVRVEPGATVRQVNARLARFGYRLGPDPASEAACTIGGVIANNSSGMACGTAENTYRTLESAVLVLPSGTILDTADPQADQLLADREPDLVAGLLSLSRRVTTNARSREIIERHFSLKNTLGYGINSFLDHSTPSQLLLHLVIGSEGTLAFVAEATFRTVRASSHMTTTLALFPSVDAATDGLPALVESGAATLELMDAASLAVGQKLPGVPSSLLGFEVDSQAALLVEYQAASQAELDERAIRGQAAIDSLGLLTPARLSRDPAERAAAWKFRKGLYASVAGARPSGTTALLEDIAVPVERLAATCVQLQELFAEFGYRDSVIFGHAKDGNIHFMLTDRFEGDESVGRLADFTDRMVDVVLAAEGNLKAEHGTGRAMAPYVRRQYGDELYSVMLALKRLCDPAGVLNPGVIIEEDRTAHLKNIKLTPTVEEEVDRCVECGYCEPVCPSRDLTLTPRQRITVRRAHAKAVAAGDDALAESLERDYEYDGKQTCAVDGMCQTACPVQINTGLLVKRLRREDASPVASAAWRAAAAGWGTVTRVGSGALTLASKLPTGLVAGATEAARAVLGSEAVPRYSGELPGGGKNRRRLAGHLGRPGVAPKAIYIPACVNSMFGAESGDGGVADAFAALLDRAGVGVVVPEGVEELCCGTPWASKGFASGARRMAERVRESLAAIGGTQPLPILSDASSCTEGFARQLEERGYEVEDLVAFTVRELLPRLNPAQVSQTLALHPTCSSTQMGVNDDLKRIGEAVASAVFVPDSWGCCAYAGDRGMLHPELTASATATQAAEVIAANADRHASCNRTCELGMTRATNRPYRHVLELLEEATR